MWGGFLGCSSKTMFFEILSSSSNESGSSLPSSSASSPSTLSSSSSSSSNTNSVVYNTTILRKNESFSVVSGGGMVFPSRHLPSQSTLRGWIIPAQRISSRSNKYKAEAASFGTSGDELKGQETSFGTLSGVRQRLNMNRPSSEEKQSKTTFFSGRNVFVDQSNLQEEDNSDDETTKEMQSGNITTDSEDDDDMTKIGIVTSSTKKLEHIFAHPAPVLVYFHGNCSNRAAGRRLDYYDMFSGLRSNSDVPNWKRSNNGYSSSSSIGHGTDNWVHNNVEDEDDDDDVFSTSHSCIRSTLCCRKLRGAFGGLHKNRRGLGCHVITIDYRGFGDSIDDIDYIASQINRYKIEDIPERDAEAEAAAAKVQVPSESSLAADARLLYDWLISSCKINPKNLFVYGHSLGNEYLLLFGRIFCVLSLMNILL
jgi:hypothetical protein